MNYIYLSDLIQDLNLTIVELVYIPCSLQNKPDKPISGEMVSDIDKSDK